jgi:hypothetical protein
LTGSARSVCLISLILNNRQSWRIGFA